MVRYAVKITTLTTREETHVKIRPNRLRQTLAAGRVATIIGGTNDPDLIDQLGTLDVDGIWLEGAPYALGMVQRLRRDHDPQ